MGEPPSCELSIGMFESLVLSISLRASLHDLVPGMHTGVPGTRDLHFATSLVQELKKSKILSAGSKGGIGVQVIILVHQIS